MSTPSEFVTNKTKMHKVIFIYDIFEKLHLMMVTCCTSKFFFLSYQFIEVPCTKPWCIRRVNCPKLHSSLLFLVLHKI